MNRKSPSPSLRLVDSATEVKDLPQADAEHPGGPLIACGGIVAPYRVLRVVKNSTPTAEPVAPDSSVNWRLHKAIWLAAQ